MARDPIAHGWGAFELKEKLRALKQKLWNRVVFGDINNKRR